MNRSIKSPTQKSQNQITKSPNHQITKWSTRVCATSVALAGWAVTLFWGILLDDHFGRITLGYQWLTYHQVPFKDFFDPGLFGAAAWSAAALWLSGGSLLGEVLLDGAAIGAGVGLTCVLASRAAASTTIGVFCAVLTLLAVPRLYDYDKVLFYPLGLWVCWRYADHATARRAAGVGAIVGIASILRYDTSLYLGATALVTLLATHGLSKTLFRAASIVVLTFGVLVLPVILWIHAIVGVRDALDQISTYASLEQRRSQLFDWSFMILDGAFVETWAAVMRPSSAAGVLYLATLLLTAVAVATAVLHRTRGVPPDGSGIGRPHLLAAATLCGMLAMFILRDPLPARFGGMLSITTVLGAAIAGPWLRFNRGRSLPRRALSISCGIATAALVIEAGESRRFERLWLAGPSETLAAARSQVRMLAERPPALGIMPGGITMRSMAWYLRQCTPPNSTIMATWFSPHVYYFAQRPFAGGMWAFFGDHWAQSHRQAQAVERLRLRPPSIVIVERVRYKHFANSYGLIAEYLNQEYHRAGGTGFERGGPPTYDLLVPRESRWTAQDPVWGLPCDSGQ